MYVCQLNEITTFQYSLCVQFKTNLDLCNTSFVGNKFFPQ